MDPLDNERQYFYSAANPSNNPFVNMTTGQTVSATLNIDVCDFLLDRLRFTGTARLPGDWLFNMQRGDNTFFASDFQPIENLGECFLRYQDASGNTFVPPGALRTPFKPWFLAKQTTIKLIAWNNGAATQSLRVTLEGRELKR